MMRLSLLVVMSSSLSVLPVYAHHSFAATYLENQKVTIEGEIVQFQFRNPHSFVTVLAKDSNGEMQRWAVEWGAGGQLGRQGVGRDTLRAGDHVIIIGDPSRTEGDHRLRMRNITRPSDGWRWGGEFD